MYNPPGAESIENQKMYAIRLGIQGAPGTGKTYAAVDTFPNPIVLDFDNALHDHYGKSINRIPFWDKNFVLNKMEWITGKGEKRIGIPLKPHGIPDRREAFKQWLKSYIGEFSPEQTIILDSWTFLQDAFDAVTWAEPAYTKRGEIDDFAPWDLKLEYSKEIMGILKSGRCHVVVIFHETQQRDKETGLLLDKIQPLMRGSFFAQLKGHFPFFFRALGPNEKRKILPSEYVWQTGSNGEFDSKCCNEKLKQQGIVKATYQSFIEYANK